MSLSPIFLLLSALLGATVGSFLATWTLRRSRGEPVRRGRSHCDRCHRELGYAETLPMISYLAQGGECRACRAPIDPLHLVGEIAGGAIGLSACALILHTASSWPQACIACIGGFVLLAIGLGAAHARFAPSA